jgi:DNA repair protein RecN (Recombination protein N)
MLRTLSIRNIVLIERLDLEFRDGLGVLTGETGSGKSILLDALGLATGARADTDLIRQGSDQCAVTAEFEVDLDKGFTAILEEAGIEDGGGGLILRRVVNADGRSRAFVNDQAVSVSLLRQIGGKLVEVHGQHETHGLLDPSTHGRFVDAFGRLGGQINKVREAFQIWRAAGKQLEDAEAAMEAAKRDEEFLRHAVEELRRLQPVEGEEEQLAQLRTMMMNGEQLVQALKETFDALNQGDGADAAVRRALQKVEQVAEKAGGRLDNAVSALERSLMELGEATGELERASGELNWDPAELEQVEERLFALRALARKHDTDVEGLPTLLSAFERRLADLDDGAGNIEALRAEVAKSRAAYVDLAGKLSAARVKAGKGIDTSVAKELPPLKLEAAKFVTVVAELPEQEWSETGKDRIVFEVQTNPNTAQGPIHKIASGGELARLMLALKVVLADADSVPTIIFDEVDAGIGGAAAAAVGDRLSRLSGGLQVLVVTHSPQVAARGDCHWQITKIGDKAGNVTSVDELNGGERTEEIARMLAGSSVTDEARAAADQLLSQSPHGLAS